MSLYFTPLQYKIKWSEEEIDLHLRERMHFILTINCQQQLGSFTDTVTRNTS